MNLRRLAILAATLALGFLTTPSPAGPPLICFPYEIGKAKSLPWGDDAFKKKAGYDTANVVNDTLDLLKTEKSALVRMETLRRATLYLDGDKARATELLAKLSWYAMDMEAIGKPSPDAWFNAGYLAASLAQAGGDIGCRVGMDDGHTGYTWITRAVELRPNDPAMHFAAALASYGKSSGPWREHLRKAVAGAEPGSDLAKSIESNAAFGHKPLKELRAELGIADAKPSDHRK